MNPFVALLKRNRNYRSVWMGGVFLTERAR